MNLSRDPRHPRPPERRNHLQNRVCVLRATNVSRSRWRFGTLALLVFFLVGHCCFGAFRITEFLAENDGGLRDLDGETPDWIELFNDDAAAANLAGWHLTDSPTNLVKWTFPPTNLSSAGLLVVFASGKDHAIAGAELHTNFRLDNNGGYLALVHPDGSTIAQELHYPRQRANVSFGTGRQTATSALLTNGVAARVLVPSNGALGLTWTANDFDDSTWLATNTPLGFTTNLLSIDFNDRSGNSPAATQPDFLSFAILSNVNNVTIQTQATTRVFGGITVTISNTFPQGYDDRFRSTPVNGGAFTESLLLRDFVFSTDSTGTGGLDVAIGGLSPNSLHQLSVWSFDSGSSGNRVSDWYANGALVTNDYTFSGTNLPTSNVQYRFSFEAISDGSGTILLSGRRDPTSVDQNNVPSFGV